MGSALELTTDAAKALHEIVTAYLECDGNKNRTAARLGVSVPTLYNLIRRHKLWKRLDAVAEKHGLRRPGGRARAPERAAVVQDPTLPRPDYVVCECSPERPGESLGEYLRTEDRGEALRQARSLSFRASEYSAEPVRAVARVTLDRADGRHVATYQAGKRVETERRHD